MERRVYSDVWLSWFPVGYLAHLIDERYFSIGSASFATRFLGVYFTDAAWWLINVPSIALLTTATVLTARGVWPQWVAIALATHLALHGLARVPTSLWTVRVAPGLVTGLVLCVPLAAATFWKARSALPERQIARGVVAGMASFQPFWHLVLLPVLPSAPAAT